MVYSAKTVRQGRAAGPIGSASGKRFEKPSVFHEPPRVSPLGQKIVASIYFAVNEHVLLHDDQGVIEKIARYCLERLLEGKEVSLLIEGFADKRYREDYNQKLSEDRASEVESALRQVSVGGSPLLPTYRKFKAAARGHGTKFAGTDLDEDRRVDVLDVSPPPAVAPAEKEERGFFFYMNNQNLLRSYFFRHYYPDYRWWQERGLDYLVDLYEKEGRGLGAFLKIRPGDYDKVIEVIEKECIKHGEEGDFQRLEGDFKTGNREQAITGAYEVTYRRAWEEARARAEKDFEASDFRHPWEFFAIKFGLVPKDTPYHKRPKSWAETNYKGAPTYFLNIKDH